jgi:hypothetical protein
LIKQELIKQELIKQELIKLEWRGSGPGPVTGL